MLTPRDAVDWSGLTHAFGEADDIPDLIEQLLDADWADAVDDLFASLLDQGRVFPATVAAVIVPPVMFRLPNVLPLRPNSTFPPRLAVPAERL